MAWRPLARIVFLSMVLSGIAPAVLVLAGVHEHDLLMVVFLPSLGVGLVSGWLADRRSGPPGAWACDTQRMP